MNTSAARLVAGRWAAATASVRGASHERTGLPNQDAVAATAVDGPVAGLVAAVADGHGGARYVRSDVGSRLAVDIACTVGAASMVSLGQSPTRAEIERALAGAVIDDIVDRWRAAVLDHLRSAPFTDAERERGGTPLDADPHVSYGCTLVLVLAATGWLGLVQVGDGDATLVSAAGVAAAPVPGDDRLVGGETTSLCLPTARADARVAAVLGELPELVVLTSDGYANSFAAPDWRQQAGGDLLSNVRSAGLDEVATRLPEWLAESAVAGGDDVSMVVLERRGPNAATEKTVRAAHPTHSNGDTRPGGIEPARARERRSAGRSILTAAGVVAGLAIALGGGWWIGHRGAGENTEHPRQTTVVATTVRPATTSSSVAATPTAATSVVLVPIGFGNVEIVTFHPVGGHALPRVIASTPAAVEDPTLPTGWSNRDGRLSFRGTTVAESAATVVVGDMIWVVSKDRAWLTPYRTSNGRLAAQREAIIRPPTQSAPPATSTPSSTRP